MTRGLAAFVVARAHWISAISLLLALLCVDYSWNHLRYSKDRTQLLSGADAVQQRFEAYRREFPGTELDVLVLVGGGEETLRLAALEDFSRGLDPAFFSESLYRVDASLFQSASLYALSPAELTKIETAMRSGLPLLKARARGGMVGLLHHLNSLSAGRLREMEPQLADVLGRLRDCFARRTLPARVPTRKSPFRDGWLYLSLGKDANFIIIRLRPEKASEGLRLLQTRVEAARTGGLTFDLVGDYAIKAEDGRVSLNSALLCSLISLVLIKLLFFFTSAVRRRPQLALLALLCGLCWSLAWATWSVGELNLVSVNFAATLVGLGMDFAIHLLFRYEEVSESGPDAWELSFSTAGKENALGALATAAAFLSLCATPFRGVAQLGWVAGCGIAFVFVAMTLLFPALISTWGGKASRASYRRFGWLLAAEEQWLDSSRGVVLGAVAFTVLMACGIPRVGFDSNLLHMSWNDSLARRSEAAFRRYCGTSCLFLVSTCPGEGLVERARALEEQPGRVESLAALYQMSHPNPEQQALVRRVLALAAEFPATSPVRRYTADELLFLKKALPAELARLEARLPAGQLQTVLTEIREESRDIGPGAVQDALESFEESYTGDVRERLALLQGQKADVPSIDLLPPLLLQRYRGVSGRWLVKFYPRDDIWDEGKLRETVESVSRVDAEVTGQPILSQRYLELLNSGYRQASWIALSVIVALLLVYFRNLERTFLALLPKLLGLTWMLGILGWSGLALNPANATALPLTLGVGLVFGVHVLHGAQLGKPVFSGSTGAAVAVSAASTILGYAALTLSPHKGIASLGWVMMIGVSANLVAAIVVLPCFMKVRSGRNLP